MNNNKQLFLSLGQIFGLMILFTAKTLATFLLAGSFVVVSSLSVGIANLKKGQKALAIVSIVYSITMTAILIYVMVSTLK